MRKSIVLAALKAGKCDVVMSDIDPARNAVKGEDALELSDLVTKEDYAIAVAKGNTKLLFVVNKVVSELKASGEMDKIIARYTEEADSLKEAK